MWKLFCLPGLRGHFFRHTGLEPSVFPLHPQLLPIKRHSQQKPFRSYICLAPGKKPAEPKVVFQQAKGALHLDGAAQTQMDAPVCSHSLRGLGTL